MSILSATIKCMVITLAANSKQPHAALPVKARLSVQAMAADHYYYPSACLQYQGTFTCIW